MEHGLLAAIQSCGRVRLSEGRTLGRILPSWYGTDDDPWWFAWHLHWNVGPRKLPVPCLRLFGAGDCAICEDNRKLFLAGGADAKASLLREVRTEYAVNFGQPHIGVQPLLAAPTLMAELLRADLACRATGGITHSQTGRSLAITKASADSDAYEFGVEFSTESYPCPEAWLASRHDLTALFRVYTYRQQQAMLLGQPIPHDREAAAVLNRIIHSAEENAEFSETMQSVSAGIGEDTEGGQAPGIQDEFAAFAETAFQRPAGSTEAPSAETAQVSRTAADGQSPPGRSPPADQHGDEGAGVSPAPPPPSAPLSNRHIRIRRA